MDFDKKYSVEDLKLLDPRKLNMCNYSAWISSNLDDTKFLPKESASHTFQALSKIRSGDIHEAIKHLEGKSIFMKVSDFVNIKKGKSLFMEIVLYRYMEMLRVAKVINFTPKYYMDFSCIFMKSEESITDLLGINVSNSSKTSINRKSIYEWDYPYKNHVLVTEQLAPPDFFTLSDLIKDVYSIISHNEIESIIYQLEYITNELNEIGIRHNDLHDENVWVQDFGTKKPLIFYEKISGGKIVRIELETRYKLLIIDFDKGAFINHKIAISDEAFSHKTAKTRPLENMECDLFGICDYRCPVFDINIILMYLDRVKTSFSKNGVSTLDLYMDFKYPNKDFHEYFVQGGKFCKSFPGRLCRKNDDCDDPTWDPTDESQESYIRSHSKVMENFLILFPRLKMDFIDEYLVKNRVESDWLNIGEEKVCVSINVRNPFPIQIYDLITEIYNITADQANIVNISLAPIKGKAVSKSEFESNMDILARRFSGKIVDLMNIIDYSTENLEFVNEKFRNTIKNKIIGLEKYRERIPPNYIEISLEKLGYNPKEIK